MLSVYLVYNGQGGVPVTIGRLDEPEIVRAVCGLAVQAADARAAAISPADPLWGEMERIDAQRLRMIIEAVLGSNNVAEPAAASHPEDPIPPAVM